MLKHIRILIGVACLLSFCWAPIAFAQESQEYIAQIEVVSRSATERPSDLANALSELVVKLSKNANADQRPEISTAKTNVLDYVMRYQYITETDTLDPEVKKLFLKVHFDSAAVQKLLQQAKLIAPPAAVAKHEELVSHKEASVAPIPNPAPHKNSFTIVVQNIDEASDYRTVLGYLSSFESVAKVEIVQLVPPQATFDVTMVKGKSKEKLAELIRLGDILIPSKTSEDITLYEAREDQSQDQPMEYKYQP